MTRNIRFTSLFLLLTLMILSYSNVFAKDLLPIRCDHSLVHVEAVAATKTKDGNIEYWYCRNCENYYSDENATKMISKADTLILADDHSHSVSYIADRSSTCTTEGNTAYYYCSDCDKYYEDQDASIPITKESTIVEATGHKSSNRWLSDNSMHWKECMYGCGTKLGIASHIWDSGTVTKQSTTTQYGEKTYRCKTCGYQKRESILKQNPLKLTKTKKTYKAKQLKSKKKTFVVKVKNVQGKLSCSINKTGKKNGIKVKKVKAGYKVTMPRKCKKGTYKLTIKAAGSNVHTAGNKMFTIVVK